MPMGYSTITVSDKIRLVECSEFGNFNRDIVMDFLRMVQQNFYLWLGGQPEDERYCVIIYHDKYPMCIKCGSNHIIQLCTHDNYWCQWVYQFSHEYCHHLINGPSGNGVRGMMWFEETVCELASIHNLYEMVLFCTASPNKIRLRYAQAVQDYLYAHLLSLQPSRQYTCGEFLSLHTEELAQPVYHREIYSGIASYMLPLFLANPNLWKIILHFGDMRRWPSLEALFRHLQDTADDSYSLSLCKLQKLLLG